MKGKTSKKDGKEDKKKVIRVGIDCFYRWPWRSREFTTPGNHEAFNMLMNKLDKKGIKNQPGKLIFEFTEGTEWKIGR